MELTKTRVTRCVCVLFLSALVFVGCSSGDAAASTEVTVEFDLGYTGAPQINSVTIDKGTALGQKLPRTPERDDGYVFTGWFVGDEKYTAGTVIKAPVKLKAKWQHIALESMTLAETSVTMTIFSKKKLTPVVTPSGASKRVTWSSSAPTIASVSADGTVTALNYSGGGNDTYTTPATGTATITAVSEEGNFTAACTINTTMAGQVYITDLPPLKESFKDYFLMGNIFDPNDVPNEEPYAITKDKPWLTHHYNILTHQNAMKPQSLCGTTHGTYNANNIATAKRMIAAAAAQDIKIQGHCLLWHQQIARWQENLRSSSDSNADVLAWLREYIKYIVNEFRGTIYAWDVLNEVFPDNVRATDNWRNVMRNGATDGNPWYMKLGADFVYEGFLAAREEDPDIILYYNDYNLDGVGKATMVRDMVKAVNERYAGEHPEVNGRKLIEGIGMQSHHNAGVSAASIKATLDLFRPLGVKISISELDLLAQTYNEYNSSGNVSTVTNAGLLNQANQYGQYFKVFLDNADIIERVTFWGNSDSNNWRSRGQPLPFDRNYMAKPAYYKMIEAIEAKKAEAEESEE